MSMCLQLFSKIIICTFSFLHLHKLNSNEKSSVLYFMSQKSQDIEIRKPKVPNFFSIRI